MKMTKEDRKHLATRCRRLATDCDRWTETLEHLEEDETREPLHGKAAFGAADVIVAGGPNLVRLQERAVELLGLTGLDFTGTVFECAAALRDWAEGGAE